MAMSGDKTFIQISMNIFMASDSSKHAIFELKIKRLMCGFNQMKRQRGEEGQVLIKILFGALARFLLKV